MLDAKQKKNLRKMIAAALMIDFKKYDHVCETISTKTDEEIIIESEKFLTARKAQLEKAVAQAQAEISEL